MGERREGLGLEMRSVSPDEPVTFEVALMSSASIGTSARVRVGSARALQHCKHNGSAPGAWMRKVFTWCSERGCCMCVCIGSLLVRNVWCSERAFCMCVCIGSLLVKDADADSRASIRE